MQLELIERGYLNDKADGVLGKNTETAVKRVQLDNGLSQTGVMDANTWKALTATR